MGEDGDEVLKSLPLPNEDTSTLESETDTEPKIDLDLGLESEVRPTIDLEPDEEEEEEERVTVRSQVESPSLPWTAVIEIFFISLNLVCFIASVWYLSIGLTGLGWLESIESIMNQTAAKRTERDSSDDDYSMLNSNGWSLHRAADTIVAVSIIIIIFNLLSCLGAYYGNKYLLILGVVGQLIMIPIEIVISETANSLIPGNCEMSPFKSQLLKLIQWYGVFHPNEESLKDSEKELWENGINGYTRLGRLQLALGCCGVDGWKDYKLEDPASLPSEATAAGVGRNLSGLPHSCCRPYWTQNIYCADGIEKSGDQKLVQSRMSQEGCLGRVENICNHFEFLFVDGVRGLWIFRIVLLIVLIILILLLIRAMYIIHRARSEEEEEAGIELDDKGSEILGVTVHPTDQKTEETFGFKEEELPMLGELAANANKIISTLREKEKEDDRQIKLLGYDKEDEDWKKTWKSNLKRRRTDASLLKRRHSVVPEPKIKLPEKPIIEEEEEDEEDEEEEEPVSTKEEKAFRTLIKRKKSVAKSKISHLWANPIKTQRPKKVIPIPRRQKPKVVEAEIEQETKEPEPPKPPPKPVQQPGVRKRKLVRKIRRHSYELPFVEPSPSPSPSPGPSRQPHHKKKHKVKTKRKTKPKKAEYMEWTDFWNK